MSQATKYICVTGFAHPLEPHEVRFPEFQDRHIFGGVLVKPKTFSHGGPPKGRYPSMDHIPHINRALRERGALPIAHYHIPRDIRAADVMVHLEYFQNALFHGVQFNTSNMEVLKVAARYTGALVPIFQINRTVIKAFSQTFVTGDTEVLQGVLVFFEALRYLFKQAHVLFDLSGGHGKDINLGRAATFLGVMQTDFSDLHPGIAGGLSPENLRSTLEALGTSNVSVDVESKVRTEQDVLIPSKATAFYDAMAEIDRGRKETP